MTGSCLRVAKKTAIVCLTGVSPVNHLCQSLIVQAPTATDSTCAPRPHLVTDPTLRELPQHSTRRVLILALDTGLSGAGRVLVWRQRAHLGRLERLVDPPGDLVRVDASLL